MKRIIAPILLLLLVSCGVAVTYDYEKSTDFSQYKTYNYFTDITSGLNELDERRLYAAIDEKLQSMGLQKSETPSFNIDIKTQELIDTNRNTIGVGLGGTGRSVGGRVSVGIPIGSTRMSRNIFIEFVDDSKTGLFWQAIAEDRYSQNTTPEKREAELKALVEKVFSRYPPK
ncbi:DUF4136 domain-containing protein [Winogradskyella sp. A3E31]|uniref:DUF4136 domain-containing protein n=1 Tax=Winogradskyella sp. A3E31 TaxID=3349637 RepID=UPI00398B8026